LAKQSAFNITGTLMLNSSASSECLLYQTQYTRDDGGRITEIDENRGMNTNNYVYEYNNVGKLLMRKKANLGILFSSLICIFFGVKYYIRSNFYNFSENTNWNFILNMEMFFSILSILPLTVIILFFGRRFIFSLKTTNIEKGFELKCKRVAVWLLGGACVLVLMSYPYYRYSWVMDLKHGYECIINTDVKLELCLKNKTA